MAVIGGLVAAAVRAQDRICVIAVVLCEAFGGRISQGFFFVLLVNAVGAGLAAPAALYLPWGFCQLLACALARNAPVVLFTKGIAQFVGA